MEINVLGPVQVVTAAGPQRVGRSLEVVLSALVVARGRPVSGDRLVDLLWPESSGGDEPRRRVTLRSHISHLRKLLDPSRAAGADTGPIVTEGSGESRYVLRLPVGVIDLDRFEAHARLARACLDRGEPTRARQLATAALALWRGDPVPALGLDGMAVALTDHFARLRREVTEVAAAAEVELGFFSEACARLEAVLTANPTNDRVRELLVVALFRDGRPADASAQCRAGLRSRRDRGLDTDALQRLQEQVLRADSALEWVAPRPSGPWQLPGDAGDFVGREDALADIEKIIRSADGLGRSVIIAVYGPPGVGKSALLRHAANRISAEYDGALYCERRAHSTAAVSTEEALEYLLVALEGASASGTRSLADLSAAFRSATTGRRLIIVVDDAADAAQVAPLLPGDGGHLVLISSRAPLGDLDGAAVMRLDAMSSTEAGELLRRFVDARRLDADVSAASALLAYCDHLPLAIRIAAGRLRERSTWPVRHVVDRLADQKNRLRELNLGDLSVRAAIAASYEDLAPVDSATLRVIGELGVPEVSVELIAAAIGISADEGEASLERLVDAQLLSTPVPQRYACHDLTRLFAREEARTTDRDDRRALLLRASEWYIRSVRDADAALLRGGAVDGDGDGGLTPHDRALDWLSTEVISLLAFALRCSESDDASVASFPVALDAVLYRFLDLRSDWARWDQLCGLALAAATRHDDAHAEADARTHRATTYARRHRLTDARGQLTRAAELYRRTDDPAGEATVRNSLGLVALIQGDAVTAETALLEALDSVRRAGDIAKERTILMNLGETNRQLGRRGEATQHLHEALDLALEHGDLLDRAKILHNLGEVARESGDLAAARQHYTTSLAISERSGDRHTNALTLFGLAELSEATGDLQAAMEFAEGSLATLNALGVPEARIVQDTMLTWERRP